MAEVPVAADLDFQGTARPKNVPAPVAPGDGVNKAYADALHGATLGRSIAFNLNLPLF